MFFPLHPDTPQTGRSLRQLFGPRADVDAMQTRLRSLMRAEGLPYGDRTHTYNSRLAQELAKWAETEGMGPVVHTALYRAYFAEGHNIGDRDVLVETARSVGLSVRDAREVLETRRFRAAVDADWAASARAGITGVPTFVAGLRRVVGAQPYEILEDLVTNAEHGP